MDISGQYRIAMPREAVWQALMDADVLRRCVPGCQSLEETAPNEYAGTVALVIGPVKATFDTALKLTDLDPPTSYKLTGTGQGGAVGFGEGYAAVELSEAEGNETLLSYTAGFQVGGRLAQLGSRLVLGTTRKLVDEFFESFVNDLDGRVERVAAPAAAQAKPTLGHRALVLISVVMILLAWLVWWLFGPGTAQ
jgi:carbon monoxide dehydrogenase subunit G